MVKTVVAHSIIWVGLAATEKARSHLAFKRLWGERFELIICGPQSP